MSHTEINSNKHMGNEGIKKLQTLWANALQEIVKSPMQCLWFQMMSCHSWSYQGLSIPISLLQRWPEGTWLYHQTAPKKTEQGKRRTGLLHQLIEIHQYHDENPELHKEGKIAAMCLGHLGVYVQPVMNWYVPTWPRNQDHVCVCGCDLIGAGVNSGEVNPL